MNLFGHHFVVLTGAQVQALKAIGHEVQSVAIGEVDKAVAAAKQTPLGQAAVNAITAVEAPGKTGPQKFEEAVTALLPEILHYLTSGGFPALEADVIDFARHFLQSCFDDFKSTTAGKIASAVLHIAGL